jgi:hypothetical protein
VLVGLAVVGPFKRKKIKPQKATAVIYPLLLGKSSSHLSSVCSIPRVTTEGLRGARAGQRVLEWILREMNGDAATLPPARSPSPKNRRLVIFFSKRRASAIDTAGGSGKTEHFFRP